jgi:hypothetical protein
MQKQKGSKFKKKEIMLIIQIRYCGVLRNEKWVFRTDVSG